MRDCILITFFDIPLHSATVSLTVPHKYSKNNALAFGHSLHIEFVAVLQLYEMFQDFLEFLVHIFVIVLKGDLNALINMAHDDKINLSGHNKTSSNR